MGCETSSPKILKNKNPMKPKPGGCIQAYLCMSRLNTAFDSSESRRAGTLANTIVTDAEGRRRFHGAFEGGFSAGYFNTVGSADGWTPSTFTSSRASKVGSPKGARVQRPEDFMDEGDDQMMGRSLSARDDYDTLDDKNSRKRNAAGPAGGLGGSIPGPIPSELIVPSFGVGKRLMQLMGWRDGQGVGPRRRKSRMDAEDDYASRFTFAPENIKAEPVRAKTDVYGIGYDVDKIAPEMNAYRRGGTEGNSNRRMMLKDAVSERGSGMTAFGLSALEDADDLDIYDAGDAIDSYDRIAGASAVLATAFSGVSSSAEGSLMLTSGKERKGHDGKHPLRGFVLAEKPLVRRLQWAPPVVPRDFVPRHKFSGPLDPEVLTRAKAAALRAALLDEAPLRGGSITPAPPRKAIVAVPNLAASSAIAARFVSAERLEASQAGEGGLKLSVKKAGVVDGIVATVDAVAAAPKKPHVKPVRSTSSWIPESLLCKRFNVRKPVDSSDKDSSSLAEAPLPAAMDLETFERNISALVSRMTDEEGSSEAISFTAVAAKESLKSTSAHDPAVDTAARPSIDLFKAIFEDDEEEEESEEEEAAVETMPARPETVAEGMDTTVAEEGIVLNGDDALNLLGAEDDDADEGYGPARPASLLPRHPTGLAAPLPQVSNRGLAAVVSEDAVMTGAADEAVLAADWLRMAAKKSIAAPFKPVQKGPASDNSDSEDESDESDNRARKKSKSKKLKKESKKRSKKHKHKHKKHKS